MEYVGWKDVRSAMRYIDAADRFTQRRIESALAPPRFSARREHVDLSAQARLDPARDGAHECR